MAFHENFDGIRRDPGRDTAQCPCHMACGIAGIQLLLTFTRDEKLIVNSPARARPIPAGAQGRSPARVKYIAQRA